MMRYNDAGFPNKPLDLDKQIAQKIHSGEKLTHEEAIRAAHSFTMVREALQRTGIDGDLLDRLSERLGSLAVMADVYGQSLSVKSLVDHQLPSPPRAKL